MTELPVINCCTPLAGSSFGKRQAVELEAVMKALADRHRLRIVNMLLRAEGEAICVCEFEPFLDLSQGTVSHHLKVLVEAGLVERETRGTRSYFSLAPGALRFGARGLRSSPRLDALGSGRSQYPDRIQCLSPEQ